tara:strand:- start:346 stop:591 length:246 start_codon:yes stop_codon:yes gene_type:complete
MDTSNILKTALGVGILGTLAVFLTYSYSGDDTIETGETNEGGDNLDTIQESATTMEVSDSNEDGNMASFWKKTYNNIANKE